MGQNGSTLQAAPTPGSPSLGKLHGSPIINSESTSQGRAALHTSTQLAPTPRALGKRLEVSRSVVMRQGAPEYMPNGRLVATPQTLSKLSPITLGGNDTSLEGVEINMGLDGVNSSKDDTGHTMPHHPADASVQEIASPIYPCRRPSPTSYWSTSTIGDGDQRSNGPLKLITLPVLGKSFPKTKAPSQTLPTHSTQAPSPPSVEAPSAAKKLGRQIATGLMFRKDAPPSPRIKGPIVVVGGSRMSDNRYSALSKRSNGSTSATPTIRTASDQSMTLGAYSQMFGALDEDESASETFVGVSSSSGSKTSGGFLEHSPRLDQVAPKGPRASAPASCYADPTPSSNTLDERTFRTPRSIQPHLLEARRRQTNSVVSAASRASSRRSFLDSLTRLMEDAAKLLDVDDDEEAPPPLKSEQIPERPSLEVITNEAIGKSSFSGKISDSGEIVPLCMPVQRRGRSGPTSPLSTRSPRVGLSRRPSIVSQASFPRSVSGDIIGERPTSHVSQTSNGEHEVPVPPPKVLEPVPSSAKGSFHWMRQAEVPVESVSPSVHVGSALQHSPMVAYPSEASGSPRALFVPRSLRLGRSRPQSQKSLQSDASTPSMSSSSSSLKTTPPVLHEIQFPALDADADSNVDAALEKPSKILQTFEDATDYFALRLTASTVVLPPRANESAPTIDVHGPMDRVIDSPTILTPPAAPLSTAATNLRTPTFAHFCLKPSHKYEGPAPTSPARMSPMTMLRNGSGASSNHSTPEQRRQGFLPFLHLEASTDPNGEEGAQQCPVLVNRFDGADNSIYYSAEALAKPMHDFERDEIERRETVPRWTRSMIGNAASAHDLKANQAAKAYQDAWEALASGGADGDKSRNTLDGKLRLGKGSKRGFDRGEIKGWLQEQAR
ncbi:BQ2448_1155 [Microbotryum intermedium]|uniref:BQ2448_1155 protein n=1 Tax=Microbotryum intermedium TaxID=269621 RepID=A0A238FCC2_9BASI|nr:BQ2448_1155 [Microbotryum intermedium]